MAIAGTQSPWRDRSLTTLAWLVGLALFFPILWLGLSSLKTDLEAQSATPEFLVTFDRDWIEARNQALERGEDVPLRDRLFFMPTLANYQGLTEAADGFWKFVFNTSSIAIIATILCMVIAIPAAYSMAFRPSNWTADILLWMLSTKMLPAVGVIMPIFFLFQGFTVSLPHLQFEGQETVELQLDAPEGLDLELGALDAATILIDNPDKTPTLTLQSTGAIVEGTRHSGFIVSLSPPLDEDLEVTYKASSRAARDGQIEALPGRVTLPAGQSHVLIPVAAVGDSVRESPMTLRLTLEGLSSNAARLGKVFVASSKVVDAVETPQVAITPLSHSVEGAVAGRARVTLSKPQQVPTDLTYTVGGTAAPGQDFSALSGSLTLPAGETSTDIAFEAPSGGRFEDFAVTWQPTKLALQDTRAGIILVYVLINMPILIWILFTYFKEIPKEILEASRMDGASTWSELRSIILPLAWGGIAATALLSIIFCWNEAYWSIRLASEDALGLGAMVTSKEDPREPFYAKMSAASIVAIAPIIIMGWFTQKQLVQGLTFGAVK